MAETAVRERVCTVCPPWVVACVHFGKMGVYMTKVVDTYGLHGPAPGSAGMSCYGCGSYSDFSSAQAEFLRRAELLRLGGGDG